MSSDLAYNMQLYFEGFQPDEVLTGSRRKLAFEKERLAAQIAPVNMFCHYLDQSSEEATAQIRDCTYCKCTISDPGAQPWKVSVTWFDCSRMTEARLFYYAKNGTTTTQVVYLTRPVLIQNKRNY